jgi:hypothetical protein
MKKFRDLEEKEQKQLSKTLDIEAGVVGADWDGNITNLSADDRHGLCSNCRDFRLTKTKYGRVHAYCYEWRKYLDGKDIISECTSYIKRGQMTLVDMKEIATLIDVEKRKAGF